MINIFGQLGLRGAMASIRVLQVHRVLLFNTLTREEWLPELDYEATTPDYTIRIVYMVFNKVRGYLQWYHESSSYMQFSED